MIKRLFLFLIIPLITGCVSTGRLYTNIIMPYSTDFNHTPVGSNRCAVDFRRVTDPVYGVSAEWSEDDIVGAAREWGITNFYYADMKIFSVMFGAYRCKTLIVYGDSAASK